VYIPHAFVEVGMPVVSPSTTPIPRMFSLSGSVSMMLPR
jgi:hypothetical protein